MARPGIGDSVEGIHAVTAAVGAGRVEHLVVERGRLEELAGLVEAARRAGADVETAGSVAGWARTDAPQGVVARCRPIPLVSLDEAAAASDPPALVVADHLEDPRNVGAIARSMVAAGVNGLVISRRRSAPIGATAFKAAAGAFEHLAVAEVSSVAGAVDDLKRLGVWTVGLDASAPQPLFGFGLLGEPVALVIGAEGRGLSRLVGERVDAVVSIPLAAGVESLNASVAAALAVFEIARVRAQPSQITNPA
jgi:23S rRNA (guanosine2251-2'-O)-methyltransferase